MTDASQHNLTADDLLKLPRGMGDRHELIEGELHTMPPAGDEHGQTGGNLLIALGGYLSKNRIGQLWLAESGFFTRANSRTVRAPDIAFAPFDRLQSQPAKSYSTTVPALVVEVVSPHDDPQDVVSKTQEWLEYGVDVVWNVHTATKTVAIFRRDGTAQELHLDDTLTAPDILPGFELSLRDLFFWG